MHKKEYTRKELEYYSRADLIYVKDSKYYEEKLREAMEGLGLSRDIIDKDDFQGEVVSIEKWYDLCELINDLASMVIQEQDRTEKFIEDVTKDLQHSINELKSKSFKDYY
jgi:hypothetical protein